MDTTSKKEKKPRNRKRPERDEVDEDTTSLNYSEMSLKDLRRLLVKRGLQLANRKSLAVILLESNDNGIDISAPKVDKPKRFEPIIKPLEPTTLYSDETRPFYGVPMNVLAKHLFDRLEYVDKVALARTCRNFYAPLMKNICATFHLFLMRFSQKLTIRKLKTVGYPYIKPIAPKPEMQIIIDQGVGITPLAVACAYKEDIPNAIDEISRSHTDAPKIARIIRMIYRHGTVDNFVANRKAKKVQNKKWIVDINSRLDILNRTVKSLGYNHDHAVGPFIINGELIISIYCNRTSFSKPEGRLLTDMDKTRKILYNYIREGIEFDWTLLPKYISDIAEQYKLIKSPFAIMMGL